MTENNWFNWFMNFTVSLLIFLLIAMALMVYTGMLSKGG